MAEARRRARRRRAVLAVAVIAVGGGGSAIYATHHSAPLAASAPAPVGVLRPGGVPVPVGGVPAWKIAGLSSTAALSSTQAWIVGSVDWRWDGSTWRSVPLPLPRVSLSDVAAVTPTDAWAVGNRRWTRRTRTDIANWTTPVIVHWNGARWREVRLPPLPGAASTGALPFTELDSVSAGGPDNVWVLGSIYTGGDPKPMLLHWNGHAWLRQPVPWAPRGVDIGPVVATGATGVWVAANGRLGYWDGGRWRSVPPPFGAHDEMGAFAATGWGDAWAVGSYGGGRYTKRYSHPLAAHWDGSAWRITPLPEVRGVAELDDVAAVRPDDVWAVGYSRLGRYGDFVLHWDGSRWRAMPAPALANMDWVAPSIAAAPDGSVWVVSACPGGDNELVRWDGTSWSVVPHPRDVQWPSSVSPADRRDAGPSCSR